MAIAIGLLKMLLELQEARKTGAVVVSGSGAADHAWRHDRGARVRVFVEKGAIVFADEGTVGETLGRILVRERILTDDQYASALERMASDRVTGKCSRLGEVVVQLGLLSPEQVHAALSAQVQEKLVRALAWTAARLDFFECHGALDVAGNFATPLEPLVVAALKLADREKLDALLAQARRRYASLVKRDAIARINAFRLRPAEDGFARALDGTRTVEELLHGQVGVDAAVILSALLLTDMLDLDAKATGAKIAPPRPKMSASASLSAIVAAKSTSAKASPGAYEMVSLPEPPKPPPRPGTAPSVRALRRRDHAKKIAARLQKAKEAKRKLPALEEPEPALEATPRTLGPMAPLLAEKAFQLGKKLVRANRLGEAVVELRRAASLFGAAEYDLWATWAEARADATNGEAHAPRLRAAAQKAIEQETERGFATFVLGHLARRAGDEAQAAILFERARRLDPEAVETVSDVRLRLSQTRSVTRGDVRALAPLLTASPSPPAGLAGLEEEAPRTMRGIGPLARTGEKDEEGIQSGEQGTGSRASAAAIATTSENGTAIATTSENGTAIARTAPEEAREEEPPEEGAREAPGEAKRGGWMIGVGVAAVAAGLAVFVMMDRPVGGGVTAGMNGAVATASARATAAEEDAGPETVATSAPAESATVEAALYAEAGAGLPAVDANKGILRMPPAADGHRVWIDGRLVGSPPPPITAACGKHTVKIGSRGRDQDVIVPCGGEVSVGYP
ncbi:MAG: hypothetical protein KF819_25425 [Labilithrix sp.]|nr:hypothetical protein [Labilithrix sp.]